MFTDLIHEQIEDELTALKLWWLLEGRHDPKHGRAIARAWLRRIRRMANN